MFCRAWRRVMVRKIAMVAYIRELYSLLRFRPHGRDTSAKLHFHYAAVQCGEGHQFAVNTYLSQD